MLLGTLDASLLGDKLAGKGVNRAGCCSKDLQSNKFIIAGYGFKLDF